MPARPDPAAAAAVAAAALGRAFKAQADPLRAAGTKAYLKSDRQHLGLRLPAVRADVAAVLREHPELSGHDGHDGTLTLAGRLWDGPTFEHLLAAVEVLVARTSVLDADDLPEVERMLRQARTWALVDPLADTVVGALVVRGPAEPRLRRTLDRWATDDDFWLRRSALLSQRRRLRPAGATDADLADFARWADPMLGETEFFVRKAIGWVLRDTSVRNPDLVVAYVRPRAALLSGVSWREVVRRLPPATVADLERRRAAG